MTSKLNVTILHLDLGIGGAERLIVDMALALQQDGHQVKILTTHHDLKHCFEETKQLGPLYPCIEVHGDWLPRTLLNGKCTALCGIMRMIFLAGVAITSSLNTTSTKDSAGSKTDKKNETKNKINMDKNKVDLYILDGISFPIPILRFGGVPILFYCHFPDKLLCVDRPSILKQVYRLVIDFFEEITTGAADSILVNSEFTAKMFKQAFPFLGQFCDPKVLYPAAVKISNSTEPSSSSETNTLSYTKGYDNIFVSINRYERKKNMELAIEALCYLQQHYNSSVPLQHASKPNSTQSISAQSVLISTSPTNSSGPLSDPSSKVSNATLSENDNEDSDDMIGGDSIEKYVKNKDKENEDKEGDGFVMVDNDFLGEDEHIYRSAKSDVTQVAEFVSIQSIENENDEKTESMNENRKEFQEVQMQQQKIRKRILLVIAGGYDPQLKENAEYLEELQAFATKFGLKWFKNSSDSVILSNQEIDCCVEFRTSVSSQEKEQLMRMATALLYTPSNEHFGIVPIEAMSMKCPVIAVNSGGPLETIVHGITGYLCSSNPKEFASAMILLDDKEWRRDMGEKARLCVQEMFSFEMFSSKLSEHVNDAVSSHNNNNNNSSSSSSSSDTNNKKNKNTTSESSKSRSSSSESSKSESIKGNTNGNGIGLNMTRGSMFSLLCGGVVVGVVAIILKFVF